MRIIFAKTAFVLAAMMIGAFALERSGLAHDATPDNSPNEASDCGYVFAEAAESDFTGCELYHNYDNSCFEYVSSVIRNLENTRGAFCRAKLLEVEKAGECQEGTRIIYHEHRGNEHEGNGIVHDHLLSVHVDVVCVSKQAGEVFRDCAGCPEMVVVPAGSFTMGSPSSETMGLPSAEEYGYDYDFERPQHRVTIPRPFAVGVYEVTFAEWDACVAGGGCGGYRPDDRGWGRGDRPVIYVSWRDARAYVRWLSGETGAEYRLLSEAEWEYAARAGTTTAYHTGRSISTGQANYGEYNDGTVPVGSFAANGFGLHDVHGNVWEWVEDCWNEGYAGAPSDGSAWERGDCGRRVLRGGSWLNESWDLRSASRSWDVSGNRNLSLIGFRVARTLAP